MSYPLSLSERMLHAEGEIHQLQQAVTAHAEIHAVVDTKLDDLSRLRALIDEIQAEVLPCLDRLEADLAEVKTDVAELKADMIGVKAGIAALLAHFDITPPTT